MSNEPWDETFLFDEDDEDYEVYECDRCQDDGHPRGCYSCGRVTERNPVTEAMATEDRRAFGAACKTMQALLKIHNLPADWSDATEWLRLFASGDDYDGAVDRAAPWIEAGWTEPGSRYDYTWLSDAILAFESAEHANKCLAVAGYTPAQVEAGELPPEARDGGLDWLEEIKQCAPEA